MSCAAFDLTKYLHLCLSFRLCLSYLHSIRPIKKALSVHLAF